jgi:hypothetical protein
MAAGNHRERGSLEFPLEMSDQFLEKSATELTGVVKPWPRRVAETRPVGDNGAAGPEMMGEGSQFAAG